MDEAVLGAALLRREQPEPLQPRLDRSGRPPMERSDHLNRLASPKLRYQSLLLVGTPGSADVSRELCAPLSACGRLLEGADASEQRAQDIRVL
jgi:hypothetical protein